MASCIPRLLVVCLIGASVELQVSAAPPAQPVKVDHMGDPLPAGALARFGTVRLRHAGGVRSVAFSPDGKTLASGSSDETIRLWDVVTGKELRQFGGRQGIVYMVLFTPDGKSLITASAHDKQPIKVWDVASGKELRTFTGVKGVVRLALSPDGKTLAAGSDGGKIVFWQLVSGNEIRSLATAYQQVSAIAFSPSGRNLAVASWNTQRHGTSADLSLYETTTGKKLRTLAKGDSPISSLAFSPSSHWVVVSRAMGFAFSDHRDVTFLSVGTGKEVLRIRQGSTDDCRALTVDARGSLVGGLVGDICYLWEAASGKEVCRLQGHRDWLRCLAFAPGGKLLATAGEDHTIVIWDVAKRRPLHSFASEPGGSLCATFQPGETCVTLRHRFAWTIKEAWYTTSWPRGSSSFRVSTDLNGKALPREIRLPGSSKKRFLGLPAPDMRYVVLPGPDATRIRLLVTDSGKELRRFGDPLKKTEQAWFGSWPAALSPDGKLLAVAYDALNNRHYRVRIWRTATGQEMPAPTAALFTEIRDAAFSQAGEHLAVLGKVESWGSPSVSLWQTATGKRVLPATASKLQGECIAFSPSGRLLAVGRASAASNMSADGESSAERGVDLHEVLTGGIVLSLKGNAVTACAVSSDGRVTAVGDTDGAVILYDAATGRQLRRLPGHRGRICSLVFSADGKTLLSGSADTTALLWDVSDCYPARAVAKLSATQVEALWADLAGKDAARAYRAIVRLSSAASHSVPLLKARLRPVPRLNTSQIRRLIAQLDDKAYAQRVSATRELGRLERAGVPLLRETLGKQPPLEVKRRVQALLEEADQPARSPERLRALRAVQVLEWAATPEAERVLRMLADGAPKALQTREANAALKRLAKRARR